MPATQREGRAPATDRERPHVLVLARNNVGNFGDRLGYHILNHLLPPHAYVTYAPLDPWTVPAGPFDLVVVGIGNSLFAPLLTDELLRLLDTAPHAIGIFGTQYPELTDARRLAVVLDRLDHWFARYEDDVARYAAARDRVTHLGDWLITACPMARPTDDTLLRVTDHSRQQLPLDRLLQKLQMHRHVYSERLHPLLCALTSAESVAFRDQRFGEANTRSGKFDAMLRDVFGRSYAEDTFFDVDPAAVIAYKSAVHGRLDLVRHQLDALVPRP